MKLFIPLIVYSFFWSVSATDTQPLTFIVHNTCSESLKLGLEYRVAQHYRHPSEPSTPFIPNNNRYHFLDVIKTNETITIPVFTFYPCAQPYCFLDKNLRRGGFKDHYKVIQGSITNHHTNQSYDFRQALFDDATITLTINCNGIHIATTHSNQKAQHCYETGQCAS